MILTRYTLNCSYYGGQSSTVDPRLSEIKNVASNGTTVNKRFYPQGEQISGTSYFYTRDHLGSIREMTNSSATIVARYDYDSYGRVTAITNTTPSDFQYAGYYEYAPAWVPGGLNLTKYRAYDPNAGRWLSRDPIGEDGGLNLYGYVGDNPIDSIDSLGLNPFSSTGATLFKSFDLLCKIYAIPVSVQTRLINASRKLKA